ncbi:DsbA family protein [Haladaptatus pallidirubidus]|uniref:Thioredoxin-like fold domain-containing protein n=1 Tax=Haladaptatus pallidirubidus TaxID=1008152 RepID=A0AAV3UBD8_9EURY|nr:thioredoxin domain-containing protein [Haladaptatus pallidirubidus]
MKTSRRTILGLVGAGLSVGAAGCSAFSNSSSNPGETADPGGTAGDDATTVKDDRGGSESTTDEEEGTTPEKIESPEGLYESVGVPSDPSGFTYARMGSEDAPVTATVYGGWKCPHTQRFVLGFLGDIVTDYVEPGDVTLEFRAVAYRNGEGFHGPDEPRAARAGLAVWNNDPDSYWTFFEYMFQNRSGVDGWATTETLVRIAAEAGVENLDTIESEIADGKYQQEIEKTMEKVPEIPIPAVPRVVVDGEPTAPTARPNRTIAQLDAALGRESEPDETTDETTTTTSDGSPTGEDSDETTTTTGGTTTTSGDTTTTTTEDSTTSGTATTTTTPETTNTTTSE